MNRISNFMKRYKYRLAIIAVSVIFLCIWIGRKEGYHIDEVISFELANAEYNPWIVPTQPQGRLAKFMEEYVGSDSLTGKLSQLWYIVQDTLSNRGDSILATFSANVYESPVWIDRDTFRDYVRCDSGDDFNLLSVYFNAKDDTHPPLFYMALHLICSIWKGEMTPWQGCILNLAAMAAVLWLIGRIGDLVLQKESSRLTAMVWFGFSMGIVATTLWIRMYALLTLWLIWLLYLHIKTWKNGRFYSLSRKQNKIKLIGNGRIVLLTVLAYWTQYFGLLFILPLAAVTAAALWRGRRHQELWAYMRSMVFAAVLGIAVYPFSINEILFGERGSGAMAQIGSGAADFADRVVRFGGILSDNLASGTVLASVIVILPFLIMAVGRVAARGSKTLGGGPGNRKRDHLNRVDNVPICMLMISGAVYFLLAAKLSPYFECRYIMAVFPLTVLAVVWLWERALKGLPGRWMGTAVLGALCAVSVTVMQIQARGGHPYLYRGYAEQVEVAQKYGEYPMVCMYAGYSFYENVMEMEYYDSTLLVREEELPYLDQNRSMVTGDGYVLLIKYPSAQDGAVQLKKAKEVFGGEQDEILLNHGVHGDIIYLIKP